MSRCFPYPPPGYTLSKARNDALIELIKLQKEKERKKEKKERRKEKKERRKEKKEKRKEKNERTDRKHKRENKTNQSVDKSDIPKHLISQSSLSEKKVKEFIDKKREAETEQLEQSSVTEEHARPSNLSVPSTSSDSTQNNSNKRKIHSSPSQGNVILLRLPSKQNEFDAALAKEQQPCSTSGRSDSHAKSGDANCVRDGPVKRTSDIGHELELQYNYLLEDCFPTQIQDACLYSDDLDWLFPGRNQEAQPEKKRKIGSESSSCLRSFSESLWPRADYLHEVNMYALPFTVPF